MPKAVLFFLCGIVFSNSFSFIPKITSCIVLFLFALVLLIIFPKKISRYLAFFVLGLSYIFIRANMMSAWILPASLENKPVIIEGYVASIPTINDHVASFNFSLTKINHVSCHAKIHLNWFHILKKMNAGDFCHLVVKLKRPHSLSNPGSFDLERFYFQENLRAQGCVLKSKENSCIKTSWHTYPLQKTRQYLEEKIVHCLKKNEFSGIIVALILGSTQYISSAQWQVFRQTGTNHLVAISGLHIGLIAGLCGKVSMYFWRRIGYLALRFASPNVYAIVSIITAFFYSAISGLSPSTQRSFIMISILMIGRLIHREISTFRCLIFSLGIILVVNPFSIFVAGFWLSFIAVGLLIYGMNARVNPLGLWWHWGRAQWVVTIGMIPSALFFFQQASLLTIPANLIAIPWVSFLVVPCCLLAALSVFSVTTISVYLLQIAAKLLAILWAFLTFLTKFKNLIWTYSFFNDQLALVSHAAAYLTLIPAGINLRLLACLSWLPLFFYQPLPLPLNTFKITVFDVGQGLATLVETSEHTLVYDTGAKIKENFDMGRAVILPYLLQKKLQKIDVLTISHGDNDHIGGAKSLLDSMPVHSIVTSVPERFKGFKNVRYCFEGIHWKWDGVTFEFLYPPKNTLLHGNNASCVLKISNKNNSILLTGDIEKKAEQFLVGYYRKRLHATILVVPHHGSKTSSTIDFIDAVAPRYAVFSYGYCNAYHHPHLNVLGRYQAKQIKTLNTVTSGAITMTLGPYSDKVDFQEFRKAHRKFWYYN